MCHSVRHCDQKKQLHFEEYGYILDLECSRKTPNIWYHVDETNKIVIATDNDWRPLFVAPNVLSVF